MCVLCTHLLTFVINSDPRYPMKEYRPWWQIRNQNGFTANPFMTPAQ